MPRSLLRFDQTDLRRDPTVRIERQGGTGIPSSWIIFERTRIGVRFLRSETCMRAFARMKGYVNVEAILFEIAAKRKVSREECVFDFVGEDLKLIELGGIIRISSRRLKD